MAWILGKAEAQCEAGKSSSISSGSLTNSLTSQSHKQSHVVSQIVSQGSLTARENYQNGSLTKSSQDMVNPPNRLFHNMGVGKSTKISLLKVLALPRLAALKRLRVRQVIYKFINVILLKTSARNPKSCKTYFFLII